jgi:hypothetical protein
VVCVNFKVCLGVIVKSRTFIHVIICGIELCGMYLIYVCIDCMWVSSCCVVYDKDVIYVSCVQ